MHNSVVWFTEETCKDVRLAGGLSEPLPAMPYALVATERRVFAGLANGQLWESGNRGDSWTALQLTGASLDAIVALEHVTS